MARYHLRPIFLSATLMAVILMTCPIMAQNHWMCPGGEKSISLEIFKPRFASAKGYELPNTVWILSERMLTTDNNASIVIDLPIVQMDIDNDMHPSDEDQILIGNPYFGLEWPLPLDDASKSLCVGVGWRIPLASDEKWDATSMGLVTMPNRFEAFIPDLMTLSLRLGFLQTLESGLNYTVNIAAAWMIQTEVGGDSELFADYNAYIWLPAKKVKLGCGLAGRIWVTQEHGSIGERTTHQLGFAGNYDFGIFTPGLHLRIPLDSDLTEELDYVYGFSLAYNML